MIREFEFLQRMSAAILSERRVYSPFGLAGGEDGARGKNLLIKNSGETINLGGKSQFTMAPGARLRIMTPGGGGYGRKK